MRAIVIILAAVLAACAPQSATLANVRAVTVSGADIAVIEVRQGTGGGHTLAPGRVGRIDLVIATDWDAAEQTMETWRATVIAGQPGQIRRTVTIAIMGRPAGPLLARYAFQRCLPTEHRMQFPAQQEPISEVWRISCENVQRL